MMFPSHQPKSKPSIEEERLRIALAELLEVIPDELRDTPEARSAENLLRELDPRYITSHRTPA